MNGGYATALFISAAVAAAVSLVGWSRRRSTGATGLAVAAGAMSFWALTYAVMWLTTQPVHMYFWLDMTYFGVVTVPPALLLFALEHTKRERYINAKNVTILFTIPVLTLAILWTDPIHHLFYGGERATSAIFDGGPWFWVNAAYGYSLLIVVLALLAADLLRSPALYKKQARPFCLQSRCRS